MADLEQFESRLCHTMMDIESLGTATPSSLCSTPELEIRGNENCLERDLKQFSEHEESAAVENNSRIFNDDTSDPKPKELRSNDSPCSGVSYKEKTRACSKVVTNKDETIVKCKWISCHASVQNAAELSEHVRTAHVEPMSSQDVFVCLWEGCKVFDKPSLSHSWLSKHVNVHTGAKPFKCMISGCALTFSSREGLARHVPSHFNDSRPTKKQKSENLQSSPKKSIKKKKKKIKILRQARPPAQAKEDFINQHAVTKIKEKLPYVMPLSCYRLGIDGAKIVFQSKVLGRRTEEKNGEVDVLLRWLPEDILPDEWVPLNDVQKHRTKTVHISQLPNDVAAELDPSFYRRLSHRKHHRK
ncbi:zinc finger protein AEBP2-like [Montipora foliosa]|uniref:zinc finger protein AEBP2-like n=1 Tax=Montipora foliosa TaxID=591990 RepID=UPI0035F19268